MIARHFCRRLFVPHALRQEWTALPILQNNYFSSRRHAKTKQDDPFKILGISIDTPYVEAKKTFLRIAVDHHPDTSGAKTDKERDYSRDVFIRARQAFEQLVEAPDGSIWHKKEAEAMPNFDDWFLRETGLNSPFDVNLDPQTIKEVAAMTEEYGGGLDRDGGMWQLAKSITTAHKAGGDGSDILRLESGDLNPKSRHINGDLRRRRK